MTTTTEIKTRTITLTGRAPIRITEDDWPVVASAGERDHDGKVECQANRKWSVRMTVRRHADGRAVVYGIAGYDTHWQGERDYVERAGVLLAPGADLAAAIAVVGASLLDLASDQADRVGRVVRDCIADLPAEVL